MHWEWPIGACLAFLLAIVTTPAGVSGAVLLLPVQLSVLHVPSPSVTPTNLLFNVAATPGGLLRFWREQRLVSALTRLLVFRVRPSVRGSDWRGGRHGTAPRAPCRTHDAHAGVMRRPTPSSATRLTT